MVDNVANYDDALLSTYYPSSKEQILNLNYYGNISILNISFFHSLSQFTSLSNYQSYLNKNQFLFLFLNNSPH